MINRCSNTNNDTLILYSECEKKRNLDKTELIYLSNILNKPFPASFFTRLLQLEENIENNLCSQLQEELISHYEV